VATDYRKAHMRRTCGLGCSISYGIVSKRFERGSAARNLTRACGACFLLTGGKARLAGVREGAGQLMRRKAVLL